METKGKSAKKVIADRFFDTLHDFIIKYGKTDDDYCYALKFNKFELETSKSQEPVINIISLYNAKKIDGESSLFIAVSMSKKDVE